MSNVPSQVELVKIWIPRLKADGKVYEKIAEMHACRMPASGTLSTVIGCEEETTNTYEIGDYILVGTEGERYALKPHRFEERYFAREPRPSTSEALSQEGFQLYRARGKIWALQLTSGLAAKEFPAGKFVASWGSEMTIAPNDYLATPYPAANEVYRIEATAFTSTYRPVTEE